MIFYILYIFCIYKTNKTKDLLNFINGNEYAIHMYS